MGKGNTEATIGWVERPAWFGIQWPNRQIMPKPCVEIQEKEFLDLFFCGGYTLDAIGYGSVFVDWDGDKEKSSGHLWSVSFYYYPKYAYAVAKKYVWLPTKEWGYLKRYFRIGCLHPHMIETSGGRSVHLYHCPDCDYDETTYSD